MKIEIDEYEKDLLIESIQHRLDFDNELIIQDNLKEDLKDLLCKIEESDYESKL